MVNGRPATGRSLILLFDFGFTAFQEILDASIGVTKGMHTGFS